MTAAPEKIEAVYGRCPYINQIMVHGESLKSCLVSLIVPDERNLMKWAVKQVLLMMETLITVLLMVMKMVVVMVVVVVVH